MSDIPGDILSPQQSEMDRQKPCLEYIVALQAELYFPDALIPRGTEVNSQPAMKGQLVIALLNTNYICPYHLQSRSTFCLIFFPMILQISYYTG